MTVLRNRIDRIWLLAKYDFKSRYYGSYLGILWAFLNPVSKLFIFYFVFGILLEVRAPDFIFYMFSGLVFWGLMVELSTKGIGVIKSKKYLLENIGLAKLDLYYSAIISTLLGFIFSLLAFSLTWVISGRGLFLIGFLYLPIWVLNMLLFGFSLALLITIITSYVKDFEHLWSLVIMLGIWINPIIIPLEQYDKFLPSFRYYNPIAGVLINMRSTFMYGQHPDFGIMFLDIGIGIIVAIIAISIFRSMSDQIIENYDVKQ